MKIGIDFDNTIVCYNKAFFQIALERGYIPSRVPPSKRAIRQFLCEQGQEKTWTLLQAEVYGAKMSLAAPYPGVIDFFHRSTKNNITTIIISHKTKTPYLGPAYDLQKAARQWLSSHPIFPSKVYFETTLEKKLARIQSCQCDYFIDDLLPLLLEKNFPATTKKILFDPENFCPSQENITRYVSWNTISSALLN